MADYERLIKLAQSFDVIHYHRQPADGADRAAGRTRHLDCYLANIAYSDKVVSTAPRSARERALDGIDMMAISRGKRARR